MKKRIFKFWSILALAFTIAMFYSCNDDKKGGNGGDGNGGSVSKIIASNVINSSTQIATVKALVYWGDDDYWGDVIAETPYRNNGFNLKLPATLPSNYLYSALEAFDSEDYIISDKNAKGYLLGDTDIVGYDEYDDEIGEFYLTEKKKDAEYYTFWFYVDRDVNIKGEYEGIDYDYDYNYIIGKTDLILKKGWNVVYFSETESYKNDKDIFTYTATSKKPSGVNYAWHFYGEDYYDYSIAQVAKSAVKQKSFLKKLKKDRKKLP